jgi:hypothetical protein
VTDQTEKDKTGDKTFYPHSDDLKDDKAMTFSLLRVNPVKSESTPPDKP